MMMRMIMKQRLRSYRNGVRIQDEKVSSETDSNASKAVNFESYFITGYKLYGQANRDFQSQYVNIYNEGTGVLYIQGVWDFSVQSSNGRMSTKQLCRYEDTDVSNQTKRVKIRGHGKSLQYKVSSQSSNDFNVIGWSSWITQNSTP